MATIPYILFAPSADQAPWQIGTVDAANVQLTPVELSNDTSPQQIAAALGEQLHRLGYADQSVVLALPSAWCLAATISLDDLPKHRDHELMLYRFEEKLPIAAEEIVADFIVNGTRALGVCVQLQRVEAILKALEANRIAVDVVTSMALLALQSQVWDGCNAVLWVDGERAEWFVLDQGKPVHWSLTPIDLSSLRRQLNLAALQNGQMKLGVMDAPSGLINDLSSHEDAQVVTDRKMSMREVSVLAGKVILAGQLQPWINLRRDALALQDPLRQIRSSLTWAIAAVVSCCICLAGAMLWRAHRYGQLAERLERQQEEVFRQVLPDQTPPPNVPLRLASMERMLRIQSGESSALPNQGGSALRMMYTTLASLPTDLRFRILELRLASDKLYLEGQALNHGDAEKIAEKLRRGTSLQIDQPQTEQREQGVSFVISGIAPLSEKGRP